MITADYQSLEPGNKSGLSKLMALRSAWMMYCDFTHTTSRTQKKKSLPLVAMNQS